MINLPPSSDQVPSTASLSTASTPAPAASTQPATHQQAIQQLLAQLQQGQTLSATVKSTQALSNSDKALLQELKPSLLEALQRQAPPVPKANNGSNHNALYATQLLVKAGSGQMANLTAITTQPWEKNTAVVLSQKQQHVFIQKQAQHNTQQAIIETIKQHLPKQDGHQRLQQLTLQLAQLPKPLQQQLLPPNTLAAIRPLLAFIHSDKSLANGAMVKQALEHSGITLENKLQQQQPMAADRRIALNQLLGTLTTNASSSSNSDTGITLKALDKWLHTLATPTPADAQQTLTQAQVLSTHTPSTTAMPASAAALFKLLGLPLPQTTSLSVPKIIEQQLKQLLEQSQSRIQFNQLRSLGLDQGGGDSSAKPLQQFHTELPLRFHEQVFSLHISIQEHAADKDEASPQHQQEQEQEPSQKERRWQVLLSFDLPNNEKLHTQLYLIKDSVSATLWAESSALCQQTQKEIPILRDQLLAHGLRVDDLTCIQGKPGQQAFELGYNLVDITT